MPVSEKNFKKRELGESKGNSSPHPEFRFLDDCVEYEMTMAEHRWKEKIDTERNSKDKQAIYIKLEVTSHEKVHMYELIVTTVHQTPCTGSTDERMKTVEFNCKNIQHR